MPITAPGQCVSVDQMESPVPGLIAQLKGIPTRDRYKAATVFVDHYSCLSFVHLQHSTNAEETIQAKQAFENYARSHGIQVKHYHADNGCCTEIKFLQSIASSEQTISFCGAYAHFQKEKN